MPNLTIEIPWQESFEYVTFSTDSHPKVNDEIHTSEYWSNEDVIVTYNAVCIGYEENDSEYKLSLIYSENNNPSLKNQDIPWGTSVIVINRKNQTAKATWTAEVKSFFDGTVNCNVLDGNLINTIKRHYESVSRLSRSSQTQFRTTLLQMDRKCAVTGELTLDALEAAHIVDIDKGGSDQPMNGILLRADLHRLFDKNILQIHPDGTITLDSKVVSENYKKDLFNKTLPAEILSRVSKALSKRLALQSS